MYLTALQAEKLNDSQWQDTSLQDFMIDDDNTCEMVWELYIYLFVIL